MKYTKNWRKKTPATIIIINENKIRKCKWITMGQSWVIWMELRVWLSKQCTLHKSNVQCIVAIHIDMHSRSTLQKPFICIVLEVLKWSEVEWYFSKCLSFPIADSIYWVDKVILIANVFSKWCEIKTTTVLLGILTFQVIVLCT